MFFSKGVESHHLIMITLLNYLSETLDKHTVGSQRDTGHSLKTTGLNSLFLCANMTIRPVAEVADNFTC